MTKKPLHLPASFPSGPWYHNSFDLFKQIPFDDTGCMYDKALSRPIDFGLAPDEGEAAFDDSLLVNVKNMFRMSWFDVVRGSWLMLKTWAANRRAWARGHGRIDIGQQESVGFIARAFEYRKVIYEDRTCRTLDDAMRSLEKGITEQIQLVRPVKEEPRREIAGA